jgi:hypothetical protein
MLLVATERGFHMALQSRLCGGCMYASSGSLPDLNTPVSCSDTFFWQIALRPTSNQPLAYLDGKNG